VEQREHYIYGKIEIDPIYQSTVGGDSRSIETYDLANKIENCHDSWGDFSQ